MHKTHVRPASGHELAQQQWSLFQPGSPVHRLDTTRSIDVTFFRFHSTVIGGLILFGFMSIALSGCGGLVVNSGSTASQPGTSESGSSNSPSLSNISCGTQSLTGSQSMGCSVYLSAAATSATQVTLKSSNATALTVPSAVTVSAGATTTGFNAVSSSVSQSVAVTITGTLAGVTKTDVITVYPAPTVAVTLSKISCGTQTLTGPTTKACSVYLSDAATNATVVTLSSSSSDLVVPSAVTVADGATSAGFSATASAVETPETVTLTASSGGISVTDAIQLNSTSSSSTPPSTQHVVDLSWDAPTSSDSIAGYNVYRSSGGASDFLLINSSIDTKTTYADSTVASGQTYDYEVKSVTASGQESPPSNMASVTIP